MDNAVLIWALGGIVILLLPIAMAKTSDKPRPTSFSGPSTPVQELSTSAKDFAESAPPPEASRQLHRGQH